MQQVELMNRPAKIAKRAIRITDVTNYTLISDNKKRDLDDEAMDDNIDAMKPRVHLHHSRHDRKAADSEICIAVLVIEEEWRICCPQRKAWSQRCSCLFQQGHVEAMKAMKALPRQSSTPTRSF